MRAPSKGRDAWPVAIALILLAGCSAGHLTVRTDRANYSHAIQRSSNEQLLLNLVRLRYSELLSFVVVNSISAQFKYGIGGGLDTELLEGGPNILMPHGVMAYAEQPTITYSPLQGSDFATRVLQELDMSDFALLAGGGRNIERVMRVVVERIGGLRNDRDMEPGPDGGESSYSRFARLMRVWGRAQREGDLFLRLVPSEEPVIEGGVATRDATLGDIIHAGKEGMRLRQGKQGGIEVVKPGIPSLIVCVYYRDERDAELVRRCLNTKPKRAPFLDGRTYELIRLVSFVQWSRHETHNEDDIPEVPVQFRSFADILNYAAVSVQVPKEDVKKGRVAVGYDKDRRVLDHGALMKDLLSVRCTSMRPTNALVVVRHRGHWFSIDDSDVTSKRTFGLLGLVFALQAGDMQSTGPLLTLPIGGAG